MDTFTRRQLLGAAGVAGVGAVAGCLGDDDDSSSDGTALGRATVRNRHDEPHSIDLIVEFDDEIEHWTTHHLEARGGADEERIPGEWPSDPGDFRVTVRLDDDERANQRPRDWNDPECLDLLVEVEEDGSLALWGQVDGDGCGGVVNEE